MIQSHLAVVLTVAILGAAAGALTGWLQERTSIANLITAGQSIRGLSQPGHCRVFTGLVIIAMLLVAPAGAGLAIDSNRGPAPSATDSSCEPPLELRERATTLHSLLAELDRSIVSESTLTDVSSRIERGNTDLNLDRYCEAEASYKSAIAIAEPALRQAYAEATHQKLDNVDAMLAAEEADGNPDPDVGPLRERSSSIREDLRNADTLQERREIYQRANQLESNTQERLPTTFSEQVVESIIESQFVAGVAGLLAIIVVVETYLLISAYRNSTDPIELTARD